METEEESGIFGKLVDALWSWRINTSGDKNNLWMHKYDIRLLMNKSDFDTIVQWLEYRKNPNYARSFESKFKNLYKNNDDFYGKLIQGKLNEEECHEQIQLLENEAKQLAQYVLNVENLCLNDETIRQQIVGYKPNQDSQPTGREQKKRKRNRPTKDEMANRNKVVVMTAAQIQRKYDRLPTVDEIRTETKLSRNQIYATTPYKEGKIAKSSAKITIEMTGSSVQNSEYYGEKSEEHSRAKRRSRSEQDELDALIDEQKKDDKSDFV